MARTPFKLRSGNTTPFKQMGSSPVKDEKKTYAEAYKTADKTKYPTLESFSSAAEDWWKSEAGQQEATTNPKFKHKITAVDDDPTLDGGNELEGLEGTEKLYGCKKGTTEYQAEADIRHPKSKKDPIFGGGASKIQERGIKYNPEGKSMAERRLEKVVGTGEWKRMSKFQQAAHQRKIDRARLSREGAQQKRRDKRDEAND